MGVMLKRYRVLITLSLILAVAHFRYELLWTSAPGLEVLRRSWSSLYRPGWAKTHGLVAKLLPQPRAESVVVGSSHLKRLITRNWVHSSEQSLRFFASTSNFAFQLYLERDLITALAPKHVIISFVPEEFKFSFHDERIYLPRPISYRDLATLEAQLKALAAASPSPAAKASISELRRWMWKSFFLRTTAFDLAASFLVTNLLRLAAPVLQPTDDLRYHLQISANSPGPTPAEQQLLSAHFLSASFCGRSRRPRTGSTRSSCRCD